MVGKATMDLDYRNKIMLAPMVRIGRLPTRLLALRYGADLVYTEELIDFKLLKTERRVNDVLGTIDFVDKADGNIIFRTCDEEKSRVILQMGTANAERALKVAKLVENDVAAIDVNMGCPKEFSIKGGMGAALLSNVENAKKILETLTANVRIPVTCKIRLLDDLDATIALAKEFEALGIHAIGVHGRKRHERPQHECNTEAIKKVAESLKIPVIANGGSKEIEKFQDILKFKELTGASSVMVARAAEWNVSIFRKRGKLPMDDVICELLKLCIDYDNSPTNSKYCVQMMLRELQETPRGKRFLECQTLEDVCDIWDLGTYCRKKQLEFQQKGNEGRRSAVPGSLKDEDQPAAKKQKLDDDVIVSNIAFYRAHYTHVELPKTLLHLHATRHKLPLPSFTTQQHDKLFRTVMTFNKQQFASSYWEKNKRFAEQGAALVALLHLGVVDRETLVKKGSILE